MDNSINKMFLNAINSTGKDQQFFKAIIERVDGETGEILIKETEYYSMAILMQVIDEIKVAYPDIMVLELKQY